MTRAAKRADMVVHQTEPVSRVSAGTQSRDAARPWEPKGYVNNYGTRVRIWVHHP